MIKAQRKLHLRVWTGLALFLPLAALVILSLAASTVVERAPQRLAPPADAAPAATAAEGTGG